MKIKRLICFVAILVIGAMPLAGCNRGTGDDEDVLTMWAGEQWIGSDFENLETFVKHFNDTTDLGFKVELESKSDFSIALASAINRGKTPDLITWGRFNTPTFVRSDYLYSLQDLIDRDGINTSELFYAEANNETIFEGKQYAIPLDLDTWGIYVNMGILNEYNANRAAGTPEAVVPTNWDELIATAKALVRFDGAGGSMSRAGYSTMDLPDFYNPYTISAGGSPIGSDGLSDFGNPQSRAALQHLKALREANVCVAGLSDKTAFANGRLAMINQSVYFSSFLNRNYPHIEYKFIPLPAYPGEGGVNGGMLGGFSLAIPDRAEKHRDDVWLSKIEKSWKFMKWWLMEEENMIKWSEVSNTLPALKSAIANDYIQNHAYLSDVAKYVENYKMRPPIGGWYYLQISVFNSEIPKYVSGQYTLDKLIEEMTKQADDIIRSYT